MGPMSAAELVRIEREGSCAWLTLDRPPLNLLTPALIDELRLGFLALRRERGVRVAVVRGAGRVTTGGMQLQELRDLDTSSARSLIRGLHLALQTVYEAPFPVVAQLHGACLGAGLELALVCDLRVAARGTLLGLPEVRVGIPSVIEAALLPGLIGPGRANELLLTGKPIEADQAERWGLVNRVVEPDALQAETDRLVADLLAATPNATRLQKLLIRRWRAMNLAGAVQAGIDAFAEAYRSTEPRDAMDAFLDKKPPATD
jgi:enoyl-CoA hydratase/carnithine racemase